MSGLSEAWNRTPRRLAKARWRRRASLTALMSGARPGLGEVPLLQLELLRGQVLLIVRRCGQVLAQLVPAVDAVGRRQGGGQDEAQGEGARRASPERAGQDVRRVGPEVGPHVVGQRAVGELLDVGPQALRPVLDGPPGEVGVALGKAHLGQAGHHFGPGKGFGQQDDVGALPAQRARPAIPKRRTAWCGGCPP